MLKTQIPGEKSRCCNRVYSDPRNDTGTSRLRERVICYLAQIAEAGVHDDREVSEARGRWGTQVGRVHIRTGWQPCLDRAGGHMCLWGSSLS